MQISRPALQGWTLQFASTIVSVCIYAAGGDSVCSAGASDLNLRGDAESLSADQASQPTSSTPLFLAQADPETAPVPAESTLHEPAAETPAGADRAVMAEQMRRAAQRQRLNESLIRDREYSVLLANARRAFQEGRSTDGLHALQTVFDASHDVFLWEERSRSPRSAKEAARSLLSSLPETDRDLYQSLHGTDAELIWDEFLATGDHQLLDELVWRYVHTSAGGAALRMRALSAMDCGDMATAHRWWRLLLEDPRHAATLECSDRLWIDVAARLSGQAVDGPALSQADLQTPLVIGEKTQTAGKWLIALTNQHARVVAADPQEEWTTAFGSDSGIRIDAGSVPSDRPLWTAPFGREPSAPQSEIAQVAHFDQSSVDEVMNRVADAWGASRSKEYESRATSNFALAVHDLVLVRTYSEVVARDLTTGQARWKFECNGSLAKVLSSPADSSAARSGGEADVEAAAIFEQTFAANSVSGMLSSDGERVYFVDARTDAAENFKSDEQPSCCNRLVAVHLLDATGRTGDRIAWTCGDEPSSDRRYFLGPPLPYAGALYVLAECADEIRLLSLDAGDGSVQWEQPISMVDRSIGPHSQRSRLACCPTAADGVIVCPTQLGTLVGVDSTSGSLRWVYSYSDRSGPSQPWRGPRAKWRECGKAEFINLPLIAGGRIVLLASQSDCVHCIDLLTGRPVWAHRPSRDDALYAAAVDDAHVLLVGPDSCRGLDVHTGELRWETRTPLPSGRGARIGNDYLLPTDDGRIVSIDVSTGRIGTDLLVSRESAIHTTHRPVGTADQPLMAASTATNASTGNLLVYGDRIVVSSATGVTVYPQARAELNRLAPKLTDGSAVAEEYLRAAELQLRLGLDSDAKTSLLRAAERSSNRVVTRAVEGHMRELIYAELASAGGSDERFDQLEELASTPEQRARFLLHRLQHDLQSEDISAAFSGALEVWNSGSSAPIAMTPTGDYLVKPETFAAAMLTRYRRGLSAEEAERFDEFRQDFVRRNFPTGSGPGAPPGLELIGRGAISRTAAALIDDGRLQDAELMLLDACRQHSTDACAEAATALVDLWLTLGLAEDAVQVIDELCRRRGGELVEDGTRLDACLRRQAAGRPGWAEVRKRMQRTLRAESAEIDEQPWPELAAALDPEEPLSAMETMLSSNLEYYRTAGGALGLFRSGPLGARRNHAALDVVNVSTLHRTAHLEIPVHSINRVGGSQFDSGHLAPVIGRDVCGVSLLEGKILWSIDSLSGSRGERAWLGPRGPRFCTVQAGTTLAALDTRNGSVLWVRRDLDHDCGLNWNDRTGIIGDHEALVVFDADGVGCQLFDPLSGVRLPVETPGDDLAELRKHQASFGRKLLYKTRVEGVLRLRYCDPLSDELYFDESLEGRFLIATDFDAKLIALLRGTRLTVYRAEDGEICFETECEERQIEGVQNVSVFQDRDRIYVHLKRSVSSARLNVTPANLKLPNAEIGGELLVIDRRSGEFWTKTVLPGRILLFHHQSLPVLITVSRVRDNQRSPELMLEVLDATSGDVLARRDELQRNTLVHAQVDHDAGRVVLAGPETRLVITYRTAEAEPSVP
ncbi:MAG: hypothetical protein DWQ34_23535 [Planctomycetota bacterium]|nr:MAG: hypothetical protein DWQ34_23535 [Planctomycetota bacterium]REK23256.1 MAG: hypothetical protein DWQ41_17690 [Planctomycetota bacterium]REK30823.1 MAG: hypothetical protein DWQ45_20495 [Planctomycetota bacterium]